MNRGTKYLRFAMIHHRHTVVILILLLALALGVQVASAHAIMVRSDPPDGAVLSRAPIQVTLQFSEALLLNYSQFELVDNKDQHLPIKLRSNADSADEVVLDLPEALRAVGRD